MHRKSGSRLREGLRKLTATEGRADRKGSWTRREDILEGQRDWTGASATTVLGTGGHLVSLPPGASKPPAAPSAGRARCLLPVHMLVPFLQRPSLHS